MTETDGLVCAYVLAGKDREVDWSYVESWRPESGPLWVHLNRKAPDTRRWLESESGLDPITCEALLADETRPRTLSADDALLLILRGVNLNPGADPEDMVSVRLWADADRVITMRGQHVMAIEDIRESLAAGRGPTATGDFVAFLTARLVDRMSPVIDGLEERLDELEEDLLNEQSRELRTQLGQIRREAVALRRYLAPQRDVLSRLSRERLPWLTDMNRARLREDWDRTTRYVEDLDATRERAAVTQEEIAVRLQDRMNRTMYVLSLVAAIFLPLGLITGLLGINVGGIPGTESESAFIVVCALLVVIALVELGCSSPASGCELPSRRPTRARVGDDPRWTWGASCRPVHSNVERSAQAEHLCRRARTCMSADAEPDRQTHTEISIPRRGGPRNGRAGSRVENGRQRDILRRWHEPESR